MDVSNRIPRELSRLEAQAAEAQLDLLKAFQETYPVGSRISWLIERSGQYYEQFGIVVRVSECWWSEPYLESTNLKTGKVARISLINHPMNREETPS